MPGLLEPDARALTQTLAAREAGGWRPPADAVAPLPAQVPPPRALAAFGLRAVRGLAVPVAQLEQLDELLRAAPKAAGGVVFSDQAREALGWSPDQARTILRGLGFAPLKRAGETPVWRRRFEKEFAVERKTAPAPHSPFAALAALQPAPARRPRRRKPRQARS
jgi:ATP-dependent RNA helicase SUPV3L1/SUV3